ncbi:MAG TPA: sigma 54-interacting transcriptional regulator [Syntrophales bacterium]|nr:sigma 54-interacting transcriptional regulator [Syntrophales bacterium]
MALENGKSMGRSGEFPSAGLIDQWCSNILDAIYDGILVTDAEAIVRYVNPEYTRITGVKPEQIVGQPLRQVRPGAILPDVIRTGIPRAGVFRREGQIEYVVDMAPIMIEGAIVGGVSVLKDITEVKRLSQELKTFVSKANRLNSIVQHAFHARFTFNDIIGVSDDVKKVIAFARRIARGDNDVLITGESGTGKEVFAQAIHRESKRSSGPFIGFSCAALSATLVESELFGYADGAFTGARKGGKAGLFEIADGGTVFLDEVAELGMEMQAKLLRALQERRIRKVGETDEVAVDVRIIAATNRDLEQRVKAGQFREDLYYRLNVVNILLPALRNRPKDIHLLADRFLEQCAKRLSRALVFSPDVYEAFYRHQWPGNVRELMNAVEYAANMAESDLILPEHLPRGFHDKAAIPDGGTLERILREVEKRTILGKLSSQGRSLAAKKRVAKELGLSLSTLYAKMKSLGIELGKED